MDNSELIYAIAFYAIAATAVASAFMVVWSRNPVISAVYLVLCFFAVAMDYVLLQAHFLAAIQVLVYAGAILVLFLMIVMLIHQDPHELSKSKPSLGKAIGLAAVFGTTIMVVTLVSGFKTAHVSGEATSQELAAFLIDMGDHPGDYTTKVKLKPEGLSPGDRELVAKDVLRSIIREEKTGEQEVVPWVKLPEKMAGLPVHRIISMRDSLIRQLGDGVDINKLKIQEQDVSFMMPEGEEQIVPEELAVEFIMEAARGKLRHLEEFGTTAAVGRHLFTKYLLPFEAASILLLAAILGVLVLSRRLPGEEGK